MGKKSATLSFLIGDACCEILSPVPVDMLHVRASLRAAVSTAVLRSCVQIPAVRSGHHCLSANLPWRKKAAVCNPRGCTAPQERTPVLLDRPSWLQRASDTDTRVPMTISKGILRCPLLLTSPQINSLRLVSEKETTELKRTLEGTRAP